jgi:hypothetical protein
VESDRTGFAVPVRSDTVQENFISDGSQFSWADYAVALGLGAVDGALYAAPGMGAGSYRTLLVAPLYGEAAGGAAAAEPPVVSGARRFGPGAASSSDPAFTGSLKGISTSYAKKLLKRIGTEPHEFKAEFVGKSNVSKFDIKTAASGELYLVSKDGSTIVPTGVIP